MVHNVFYFARSIELPMRPYRYWISDSVDTSEPTPLLAKYPERSAGQAGGIPKYRRLALLDTYVFWLAKTRRTPLAVG